MGPLLFASPPQEFLEAERRREMRHVAEAVYRLSLDKRLQFEMMLQAI